jgi:hypothetical protein
LAEIQSQATEYKHQQRTKPKYSPTTGTACSPAKIQGGAALRCCRQFFMSWFLQPTHLHYFIFLQMKSVVDKKYLQKNKQVQPQHRSKNPRHKKLPEAALT